MTSENVTLLIENAIASNIGQLHFGGGEPLLSRGFWLAAELCATFPRAPRVTITTNGSMMTRATAEKLCAAGLFAVNFSLDSATPEHHDSLRGHWNRTVHGIETFLDVRAKWNRPPRVGLYVVITRHNYDGLEELQRMATAWGIDYIGIQPMFVPENHSLHAEWSIRPEDVSGLSAVLSRMRSRPGPLLPTEDYVATMLALLAGEPPTARERRGGRPLFFVETTGHIYRCPNSEIIVSEGPLGQIHDLAKITRGDESLHRACPHLSLDCLCLFEFTRTRFYEDAEIS